MAAATGAAATFVEGHGAEHRPNGAAPVPAARAYVTLLAPGAPGRGVLRLAKALREKRSAYPLVVLVPPNLPEADRLRLVKKGKGCIIHEMEVALPPPLNEDDGHIAKVYEVVNSKITIGKLLEYERVVFLDARIKALRKENLDELFHLEEGYLYAWFEGFRRDKEWIRTPQYKIVYNGQEPQLQPDDAIAWAHDDLVSVYLNAGVFVHEPGAMDFTKLLLAELRKPFTGKIILDAKGAEMGGRISASSTINWVAGGFAVGFFVLLLVIAFGVLSA